MQRRVIYNGGVSEVQRPRGPRPSESQNILSLSKIPDLNKLMQLCDDPECSVVISQLKELESGVRGPFDLLHEPKYLLLINKLNNLVIKNKSKDMVVE